jgi:hypothetical protein
MQHRWPSEQGFAGLLAVVAGVSVALDAGVSVDVAGLVAGLSADVAVFSFELAICSVGFEPFGLRGAFVMGCNSVAG